MKSLKNLTGAKELSSKEQKSILGGKQMCNPTPPYCPTGTICVGNTCEKVTPEL